MSSPLESMNGAKTASIGARELAAEATVLVLDCIPMVHLSTAVLGQEPSAGRRFGPREARAGSITHREHTNWDTKPAALLGGVADRASVDHGVTYMFAAFGLNSGMLCCWIRRWKRWIEFLDLLKALHTRWPDQMRASAHSCQAPAPLARRCRTAIAPTDAAIQAAA
jgi:hypothetical protein